MRHHLSLRQTLRRLKNNHSRHGLDPLGIGQANHRHLTDRRQSVNHFFNFAAGDVFATRLVLIAPAGTKTTLNISQRFPLAASLGANGRLSLADPQSVPAGRYAKTALTALRVWDEVATRIAVSDNVRTAMSFVARGEAPLGIVYETDARVEARVKVLGVFPADSHPPIHYPAAVVRGGDDKGFLAFLASAEARAIAVQSGFTIPADLRR